MTIDVLDGVAWIVHDLEDIFVEAGETLHLKASNRPTTISSHHRDKTIIFAVEYHGDANRSEYIAPVMKLRHVKQLT